MSSNKPAPARYAAMQILSAVGLLAIAVAVAMPIAAGGFPHSPAYKWIYSAGALAVLVAALLTPAPAVADLRERRWKRIESWGALFFAAAAFFLWYPGGTPRDWLAFTLAGAAIRVIVFIRNTHRQAKQTK